MRPHEKHGRVWRKTGRRLAPAQPAHKKLQQEEAFLATVKRAGTVEELPPPE
jgi:hypothetical protein